MLKYSLKRTIQSLITVLVVVTAVFMLLRLMPEEGYFKNEDAEKLTDEQKEIILEQMGLRDPMHIQLKNFYIKLFQGDLGKSNIYRPRVDITKIIAPKIKYSLAFGLISIVISLVVGIPLGMLMASYKGKLPDMLGSGYVVIINAVPAAIYYLFLQIYVSQYAKIPMLFDDTNPKSWLLPAICMSLGGVANYALWIRRYMLDEMNSDYIKLARAKGLTNGQIMRRHVIRNAFVPMAQYLPTSILLTVSGSIYVEALFSIPGMGGLLVTAVQRQDNTLVQALVIIFSAVGILGLLFGDILMALIDPRIKLDKKGAAR